MYRSVSLVCLGLCLFLISCSKSDRKPASITESSAQKPEATSSADSLPTKTTTSSETPTEMAKTTEPVSEPAPAIVSKPKKVLPTIQLGGGSPTTSMPTSTTATPSKGSTEEEKTNIRQMLKPFQILVGSWRGITNKAHDGDKVLDQTVWAWDLLSNPSQPSLVMKSDKNPHLHLAKLTYDTPKDQFVLNIQEEDNLSRTFKGNFSQPVVDKPGDDDKLQRTYKLEMTEEVNADAAEQWKFVFNQQENNRYLLEIYRKKGKGEFVRVDTVATQRDGTSFAISDTDYGDRTCIISQGLGTMQVSYQGKNFWVCCTGCKAAFEAEPERWIALWEEKKKK